MVSTEDARLEFMMNALRLNDGFDITEFEGRTGETIIAIRSMLEEAESQGLITRDLQRVKTTEQGARYLDTLLQIFMPADTAAGKTIPIKLEQ